MLVGGETRFLVFDGKWADFPGEDKNKFNKRRENDEKAQFYVN